MRTPLAIIALLAVLPVSADAADILINNGDDCSNPANVIDDSTYLFDTVHVRNVGCGTPDPGSPCPSPGDPTEVCVTWGGTLPGVDQLHVYDSSAVSISGGVVFTSLHAYGSSTVALSDGQVAALRAHDDSTVTMSGGVVSDDLHSFDSSTVTLSGGEIWDNLYAYDDSTVTMNGWVAYDVGAHGSSTITMNDGASSYVAYTADSATLTMNHGDVTFLGANNSSTVTLNGGWVNNQLDASEFSTVTLNGGWVDYLVAGDSSNVTMNGGEVLYDLSASEFATVTLSGGRVDDELYTSDSSTVTIVGRHFEVGGVAVPYGDLTAQTGTLTGRLSSGDPIDVVFYQGGGAYTGTITLLFDLSVPALPRWGYVALAGGLIAAGAAVMWRRTP